MKNYITQSIKIIALALIIGGGISAVSAWTAPTVNPPATGSVKAPINDTAKAVFAAVNTTDFPQIKQGGFIVSGVDKYLVAPMAFFKKVLLPGADTSVYVGGLGTANPSFSTTFPSDRTVPLTINMADRPTTGAVKYLADADSCTGPTKIITDSSAFQFWNESGNDNTDVLAKGIRLTGGNPSPGKILIAVDSDGKAVWATPRLAANGKDIIFDTNTSPVGLCDPVTPTDVCPNIDGNQPTVPTGMTVDGNGFCVIQQGQVDVCQNITGIQETIPAGMVSDGAGNCMVDLCQNIDGVQTSVPFGYIKTPTGNAPGICELLPICGSNMQAQFSSQAEFNRRDKTKDCEAGSSSDSLFINGIANWSCISGNQETTCTTGLPTLPGCFIEDTKITMANGTVKNIQDVKVGDSLKSMSGKNTVLKLLRPKLGNQGVYSINNSDAFFTANHPFMTTEGWKSLDPETTKKEIPTLAVTLMTIGDVLVTESGSMVITSIERIEKSASTQLFNFELDGDHTYFANGYAVHNKEDWPMCNYEVGQTPPSYCNPISCTKNTDCSGTVRGYCSAITNTCQDAGKQPMCNSSADCSSGLCYSIMTAAGASYGNYCLTPTNP